MGARKESSAGGRSASRTATDLAVLGIAAFALLGPRASLRGWWRERAERIDVERTIASAWGALTQEGGRLGAFGGERVLIEFGDYECPFCRSSHETTAELLARRPDLTLVYRHLPLTAIHPSAEAAARASICAERAGRFQAMHDFLYETEEWRKGVDWADVAREVGVANIETFEACLESVETDERLERDADLADRLGLTSTPSFVGRGGVRLGSGPTEELEALVGEGSGG